MTQSEWLLPQPEDTIPTSGLRDSAGELDPLAAPGVIGIASELVLSLPITDERGHPTIPPDRHILDHLARAWALVDEDTIIEHPFEADTVAVVDVLPRCDRCGAEARYDTAVLDAVRGRCGAYICLQHIVDAEYTTLGMGAATYIMKTTEVPASIRQRVNQRLVEQDREPRFAPFGGQP